MIFRKLFPVPDCDFRSCGYLFEYCGIADDFAEHSNRAGRANFVSLTYRGGTEEDAERIAVRPVT